MNDIPEEALRTIEEIFATRFVQHAADEAEPDAGQPFASVFPENAAEVESLTKLAAHHRIPLVARGAGTALYPGKAPQALAVRFDAMREIRLPKEPGEDWVEVEPGVTWMVLQERLREGNGTDGLPYERVEVYRRRLAGRERAGCGLLRVRLAASERPLDGGRAGWGQTRFHRGRNSEALCRIQRQHGVLSEGSARDEAGGR
jgi:hypothetical protein